MHVSDAKPGTRAVPGHFCVSTMHHKCKKYDKCGQVDITSITNVGRHGKNYCGFNVMFLRHEP